MMDLVGQKIGNWFVEERGPDKVTHPPSRGRPKITIMYWCVCSCAGCEDSEEPTRKLVYKEKLLHGRSLECGRPMPERSCRVDGCNDPFYAGGFCRPHWYRQEKYGDPLRIVNQRHGRSKDKTYRTWSNMIARCTNPKTHSWCRYGGASPPVIVCERWMGVGEKHHGGFAAFVEDMGDIPSPAHQIHRVNNVSVYSPETCVWIEKTEHRALHRSGTPD